jgi:membrane dipeptidase
MDALLQEKSYSNPSPHSIRWDAHGCPPFKIGTDLSFLDRYKNAGVNFISLNVGFDLTSQTDAINLINYFHSWIENNNQNYLIIENINQLTACQAENKLGIAFDIEGCNLLNDDIEMISKFYAFGVKQMSFVYNKNNIAGGGCLDDDIPLTGFGKKLVDECNRIGMIIDCSHVSYQTSMNIMELSEHPVVFSHSNPAGLVKHPRNITDDQIVFCAEKNGVIGINGIGIFLGNNNIQTEKIVEHIDYVAQMVGSEHVGIGFDCVFDMEEAKSFVENNPTVFPGQHGFNNIEIAKPEQFAEIEDLLVSRGYSTTDINNILGDNFFRVAKTVWK